MKVTFLDIDGVLNSMSWARYNDGHVGTPRRPWHLDPRAVRLLQNLVDNTGAYIVVSSTWRRYNPAHMQYWFAYYNWYEAPIIDSTSCDHSYNVSRGDRIREWLQYTEYDVTSYVVIDDTNDGMDDLPLVQPSFDRAELTHAHFTKARNLLNSNES